MAALASIWTHAWVRFLRRLTDRILSPALSMFAAGIAFFGLLAVFPAIAVFVTVYGLVANAADVQRHLSPLRGLIPYEAYDLLAEQLTALSLRDENQLSLGAVFGFILAVWSAASGSKALMSGLNFAYAAEERRNYVHRTGLALALTFGGIGVAIVVLAAVIGMSLALKILMLPAEMHEAVRLVRWLGMGALVIAAMTLLYRFGPSHRPRHIYYLFPGAIIASALWLLASAGFSLYIENFGAYDRMFGSVGAVVVLLMWFYVSAYAVCIGAEINAELEREAEAAARRQS